MIWENQVMGMKYSVSRWVGLSVATLSVVLSASCVQRLKLGNGLLSSIYDSEPAITTIAAETQNNTSTSNSFNSSLTYNGASVTSTGDLAASNISKVPLQTLLYPGATTQIYAHLMPWFGTSSHMNVGYSSDDPVQIKKQVTDMLSRGIAGVVIDWYGPNHNPGNNASLGFRNESESRGGTFKVAIMEDKGAVDCSVSCTQGLISDLKYVAANFFPSPSYPRVNGRPILLFFGVESLTIDWPTVQSAIPENPYLVFENAGGFSYAQSGGAFSWVGHTSTDPYGLSYLSNFYSTSMNYPSKLTFGSTKKGFNDLLAAWSLNRIVDQQCGQTWLETWDQISKQFNASKQLEFVQLVTWNDYEEGTELESGIDNCLSISASIASGTLTWNLSGQGLENTIDHYSIYLSPDGVNLQRAAIIPAGGSHSITLDKLGGTSGQKIYVKAFGKPTIVNHLSNGASIP